MPFIISGILSIKNQGIRTLQRSNASSFNSHRIVAGVAQTAGKMPKPLVHCCYDNLRHNIYASIIDP
jgi:hypothetical protein